MKRILILITLTFAFSAGLQRITAAEKLNVLFVFTDDQRADTIAALGNGLIHTPNLDRLVRSGIAFDQAYMQGSLGAATCIPSRAMLLSGKSLFRADRNLLKHDTWPAAFGRAGYRTFIAGKWHNGGRSVLQAFQEGRAMFLGGMGDPMQIELKDMQSGKLAPSSASPGRHACARMADAAIEFLQRGTEQPFFCYLALDGPHDPHIVPDDYPVHYDPASIPLPPNFLRSHPFDNGGMTIRDELLLPTPRTPEAIRSMLAEYYRYVSYLDLQIGRVLDALAASPHAKNTIIVFSSDSGVARGSHGLIGKQNLYEFDSVRVPLIISGPGIAPDQRTDAMCYLFDVLPTLGKLCGVPAPRDSEGIDFGATLRNPSRAARTEMLYAYYNVQRAVRQGEWKLIRYPKVNRTQLFNVRADPYETKDLAEQPQYAEKIAEMMAALRQQQQEFGDPLQL